MREVAMATRARRPTGRPLRASGAGSQPATGQEGVVSWREAEKAGAVLGISNVLGRAAVTWTLVAFALPMAYGGGLWMHLLHEAEGDIEVGAPPWVLHWLRDSTLALPLMFLAAWLSMLVAAWQLHKYGRSASPFLASATIAAMAALVASVAVALASPMHGFFFPGHGADHELPFLVHMARDGAMVLPANLAISALVCQLLGESAWAEPRAGAQRRLAERT